MLPAEKEKRRTCGWVGERRIMQRVILCVDRRPMRESGQPERRPISTQFRWMGGVGGTHAFVYENHKKRTAKGGSID
jgi:hypothetical protein